MSQKIGFVGLGRMGANMARRLNDEGLNVSVVFDIQKKIANALAKEIGATATASLAKVTELADVIITVVTDDKAMDAIFSEKGKSLLTGAEGKIFVNCATVAPATHIKIEKRANKVGASTLEGCMASSITQAREGTLYLMLGGDEAVFKKVSPVLRKLSKKMSYIGATGEAAKVKALVNMVMNINTAGLAEGLGLADALGLDLGMVQKVFSETGANSRVLVTDGEDMEKRDHECYFSSAHAAKDSGIALKLGKKAGIDLPLATATKAQYDLMIKKGLGELDKSGVAELTFKGRGGK
ncbi:MAG: 3-hydroxyisobutyrate dehydrogenase [Candidatus Binatia bacterium]|jgi:3-hydroxyisobutyrate dehydrogenase